MIMILFKSLRKRTSTGSYYDEKSLTKCYWDGVFRLFSTKKPENSVPNGLFGLLIGNLSILHQYKFSIEACCLFIVVGDVKHGQI